MYVYIHKFTLCIIADVFVDIPVRRLTLTTQPGLISNIKTRIQDETGISCDRQQLQLEGKPLKDSFCLSSSAHLTLHLETG